uniref:Uncharacterized protein n=1 Tax=Chenopodium quinoa TaxID=63459 RepID=A0A803N9Y1_CHEQI
MKRQIQALNVKSIRRIDKRRNRIKRSVSTRPCAPQSLVKAKGPGLASSREKQAWGHGLLPSREPASEQAAASTRLCTWKQATINGEVKLHEVEIKQFCCCLCAMDSSVATDPNNAKDYIDVDLERIIKNSIEKESATNVGSSGAAADVGSSRALVAKEKISEKKKKRIKVVATKGKGKKVEKRVKEKHNVKFEDPDGEDVGDEVQGSKCVVYGTLRNRMSPSSVVNVFKEFSEDQLIAIRAIGFGSLEFLKVSQLPLHLGFWLVKHFDAHSCTLNIPDSEPFKITEQHVHEVLGLPAGGIEMDANVFSTDDKVINQWKKQFKKNSLSVNIRELSMYLKNHKSAGPMFKRNFVVLCVSTLMSGEDEMG